MSRSVESALANRKRCMRLSSETIHPHVENRSQYDRMVVAITCVARIVSYVCPIRIRAEKNDRAKLCMAHGHFNFNASLVCINLCRESQYKTANKNMTMN